MNGCRSSAAITTPEASSHSRRAVWSPMITSNSGRAVGPVALTDRLWWSGRRPGGVDGPAGRAHQRLGAPRRPRAVDRGAPVLQQELTFQAAQFAFHVLG